MMYQDKFVVAIKAAGKVLRETKDLVHLPFGSEFSVLVKNLNSRRAKFTLNIDGQDVLGGTEIIVDANSEVEMKRFIRNGNMNEGNAFKFIERTQAIEDGPRGIKVDDGVVRVEFWFEQEAPDIKTTYHRDIWYNDYRYGNWVGPYFTDRPIGSWNCVADSSANNMSNVKLKAPTGTNDVLRSAALDSGASYSATSATASPTAASVTPANDVGITVPGSKVDQKFQAVYGFNPESHSNVIIIRLVGRTGAINIAKPVTVKTKQKCSTCDHTNKANAKFCSECGTGLEII